MITKHNNYYKITKSMETIISIYVITPLQGIYHIYCTEPDTQHNTVTTVLIVLIKHFTTSVHCIKHQSELQCTGVPYQIYCTATPFEVENK